MSVGLRLAVCVVGFWCLSMLTHAVSTPALAPVGQENASSQQIVIRILAKVGDTSISSREVLIKWLLSNPKSYVVGRRDYYSSAIERQMLQKFIVQVLVEEENKIVGTQVVSQAQLERELTAKKRAFGSRWQTFLNDFELSESEVRTRLGRALLVDQTLDTRLRDSMQGNREATDDETLKKAEDALQTWLQQLRSRYKVQIFRYDETKPTPSS
jgi:hypothetical protein